MPSPHNNQQLFSDHYLDHILPQRQDWQALTVEAEPVMAEISTLFKKYIPTRNEAQTQYYFVKPVLETLGHTLEVQPTLRTPEGIKILDYVFYYDLDALYANRGEKLTKELLHLKAFAIGEAKYWNCPLDKIIKSKPDDICTEKNPSYRISRCIRYTGLDWGILTNGRLWRLYHKDTAYLLHHFYEIDLPALLESGDVHKFLFFYAFFRRKAFERHSLSVTALLQESMNYEKGIRNAL